MKVFAALLLATLVGCARREARTVSAEDSLRIVRETLSFRAEAEAYLRNDPESPFRRDSSARYVGLRWFPPDVRYALECPLQRYPHPEDVVVFGTQGEARSVVKYGYFLIPYDGKDYRLNVYKSPDEIRRLSVWFTDETTGKETYEVGRYVNIGDEFPDAGHRYMINFNNAYNPYCAYSATYSCAVPRKEDHLGFPVRAGEMKYHP
jgi:uncharacterized protein (DUF1684 family)